MEFYGSILKNMLYQKEQNNKKRDYDVECQNKTTYLISSRKRKKQNEKSDNEYRSQSALRPIF